MKTCKKCLQQKPITEFYKQKRMLDGRLSFCISCVKERIVRHRLENIERIKEYDRNRPNAKERARKNQLRDNRISKRISGEKWRMRNKEKKYAHGLVAKAIKSGRLLKKPCEVCGNPKSNGHHEDYSKPLDVIWLCHTHHVEAHKRINEQKRKAA